MENLLDSTDITTHAELIGVRNESLRNTLRKNVYGSDMKFEIVAINDAVPMSSQALEYLVNSPDEANTTSQAAYNWIFKGRIVDKGMIRPSPHVFLLDPCDVKTSPQKIKAISSQFLNLYTDFIIKTNTAKGVKKGDRVTVSLRKGQPYQFDLQYAMCENATVEGFYPELAQETQECQSLADIDFDSGARVEYPPRDWGLDEPLTANEMFEKLKASPYFDGFSDNFLWGMVSNSQYESGHIVNNAGDPESKIGKRKFEPVRKFCSFGYWQLNLCSGDGQGTSFLEVEAVKKLLPEERVAGEPYSEQLSDQIFNLITSEAMQFSFVAGQTKKMFPGEWNSDSISAEAAGETFCRKFENPASADTKCPPRGKTAEQLKRQATSSS